MIQTSGGSSVGSSSQEQGKHQFLVNKYYINSQQPQYEDMPTIKVEQIVSERTITQCEGANFSFKLTNPSNTKQLYSFSLQDFDGT